jgi:hypothetical protein
MPLNWFILGKRSADLFYLLIADYLNTPCFLHFHYPKNILYTRRFVNSSVLVFWNLADRAYTEALSSTCEPDHGSCLVIHLPFYTHKVLALSELRRKECTQKLLH